MPPSTQSLVPSSTGTTSPEPEGPKASSAWCLPPRNPLFLRRLAPRPRDIKDRRRARRGASLHAIPCSFVDWHHVPRAGGARGGPSEVPHSLQPLVPSLTGTTSPGHQGPPAGSAWCLTPRNPLFLRRLAPRLLNLRAPGPNAQRPAEKKKAGSPRSPVAAPISSNQKIPAAAQQSAGFCFLILSGPRRCTAVGGFFASLFSLAPAAAWQPAGIFFLIPKSLRTRHSYFCMYSSM